MITKNPETEFDRLIQARLRNTKFRGMNDTHPSDAAKPKYTHTSPQKPNFHRDNYRPDPIPNRPVNYANFFARAGTNPSPELAGSKLNLDPAPPSSANEPAAKRYKYQGKTYKEEPIGKR